MKRSAWAGFLMIELLLYITFLSLDISSIINTNWLKFASILLVALTSLMAYRKTITTALWLTAAADVFLLPLDCCYPIGISLFFLVQMIYSVHLHSNRGLAAQILVFITAVILNGKTDQIAYLAIGYFIAFIINLIHAGATAHREKTKSSRLFIAGLLLFFCCDICVGCYNVCTGAIWSFARVAMWAFYLPGQILILWSAISIQGEPK